MPVKRNSVTLHAFNRRILAEDLVVSAARTTENATPRHNGRPGVDPNPHQIDVVIFALRRLREGGCILADEVGLGRRSRWAWCSLKAWPKVPSESC